PDASRHDVHAGADVNHYGYQFGTDIGCKLCSQARSNGRLPGCNLVAVRHSEINIMAPSRRDFLRTSACALGGMALASTVDSLGLIHAMTPQAATSYKALVCIFLNGGNDGNNLLVSLDQYSSYASGRGVDLAIPSASLLPVSPLSGGSYGFHPQMPEIRDLFNQNRCAVVTNVGPLVEPLTKTTYQNGTGKKPLQLFSHSDQIGLFQTGVA